MPVADWLAHHDAGSATGPLHETALDNARDRLLTLGAGLLAAAALVFTALNFSLLRRNSEQADQWQRRTHELTEQGQVTDRYTKAIEQLGSDKLDVRIGGIYALERIARDSARDHPTVMEVLTAFIREHSQEKWDPDSREHWDPSEPDSAEPPRPDILAAVTVVGRRDARRDIQPMDLTGAYLRGAYLRGAYLRGAYFCGAKLTGANLTGADLNGAILNRAILNRAILSGARLNGADLNGARLSGADLTEAYLNCADLTEADLVDVDLTGAILGVANLTLADLTGANLTRADLTDADLSGAQLSGAQLSGVQLSGANLALVRWPEGTPVPEGWELDAGSAGCGGRAMAPGPAEGDWPAAVFAGQ